MSKGPSHPLVSARGARPRVFAADRSLRRELDCLKLPQKENVKHGLVGSACEAGPKLLTVNVHGTSEILGPSQAVPDAMEVIFTIETKVITPAAAGVDFLKGACPQYPWMADEEQDIKKDGCGELSPSEAECPVEYDLSALVDGVLYFGDRSHPLCSAETRPATLSQWGIVKQP